MQNTFRSSKAFVKYYAKWISISAAIGVGCGIASAVFLLSLEWVTKFREQHSWLLLLLPLGGLIVGWLYHAFGKNIESGNNLLIDQFHDPQTVIPFRMAPLVLLGTIVTHLFGGSAGREGTAVQMGGSIADQFTHFLNVNRSERRTLLMAGMAGGFGSVFGVPLAGTIFGLEVLAIGQLHLWGIIECAVSAFVAHNVALVIGVHHTSYPLVTGTEHLFPGVFYVILLGLACGLAARLFALFAHTSSRVSKRVVTYSPLRAFLGGVMISAIFLIVPTTTRYAGLGVPIIVESLKTQVPVYDWLGKLSMTALTLGMGFKGGEVTPLLFVGSTLGNAFSHLVPMSISLLSAIGFVAVFAGAANTPLACSVMAMELFGKEVGLFALFACLASYALSGHKGIYHAQRIHIPKSQFVSRAPEFLKLLFTRPRLTEAKTRSKKDGKSDLL